MNALRISRAALGALYLCVPRAVLHLFASDGAKVPRTAVLVLGVRQLAQAAFATSPGHARVAVGADAAHLTSLVGLAILSPRWRRLAAADATIAASLCVAGCLALLGAKSRRSSVAGRGTSGE
jgi:hypothetical protein